MHTNIQMQCWFALMDTGQFVAINLRLTAWLSRRMKATELYFLFFFMVCCLMKFIQYKILRARVILEAKLIFFYHATKGVLKMD